MCISHEICHVALSRYAKCTCQCPRSSLEWVYVGSRGAINRIHIIYRKQYAQVWWCNCCAKAKFDQSPISAKSRSARRQIEETMTIHIFAWGILHFESLVIKYTSIYTVHYMLEYIALSTVSIDVFVVCYFGTHINLLQSRRRGMSAC